MSMDNSQKSIMPDHVTFGNVYIMTHSIFSDVIKIGCTAADIEEYTQSLSMKSPGFYKLFFTLACENACQVSQQLRKYFDAHQYVNEFYQMSPEIAKRVLKREVLKISILSIN